MSAKLFSPFALREVQLANRIVVSPMCQYQAENGRANDWHLMHLGSLAVSGYGLVIVEATAVQAAGRITPACLGLYDDACEEALGRVVAACRRYGNARLGLQLGHAGRKASVLPPWQGSKPLTIAAGGWEPVSASALAHTESRPVPRALTEDELTAIVDAFAAAAARAAGIGFDVLELHAAHGYLLHQFLSPLANRRDDRWGGSREQRMRFPLRVFRAVRATWPAERPLGVRISATDHVEDGWSLDDSIAFAKALQAAGCDFVTASSGGISARQRIVASPGYQVPFAHALREATGLPAMAVGLIQSARQSEQILEDGHADLIAIARAALDDPRWPWHAAAQLGEPLAYAKPYERAHPSVWTRQANL